MRIKIKPFQVLLSAIKKEIQNQSGNDLTGVEQNGFKRKCGSSTLPVALQFIIARALDNDEYVALASLDLNLTFDMVNINLLIKRLRSIKSACQVI